MRYRTGRATTVSASARTPESLPPRFALALGRHTCCERREQPLANWEDFSMRYLTLLGFILLACGGQDAENTGPAVPAPSGVTTKTPEGVTFTVPAGFSYEMRTERTSRVHVMKNGGAGVVLAVLPLDESTCEATFVTAHGLPGCATEEQGPDGSRAAVIVRGKSVGVAVLTTTPDGGALVLARTVADTVLIPTASSSSSEEGTASAATDARFFGCFSQVSSYMEVSSVFAICLYRDGRFRYQAMVRAGSYDPYGQSDARSSAYGDVDDSGKWSVEPFASGRDQRWKLHFIYDDGRKATWEVSFYNGDLVRGETDLWERD